MAQISLFGLTIDSTQVLSKIREAGAASAQLASDGAKSAQLYSDAFQERLNRVSRTYIPETIAAIERLKAQQQSLGGGGGGIPGLLTKGEVAAGVAGYEQLIAAQKGVSVAQEAAAVSTGMHGLQLGRLNMELGTAIGRFTGLNTAATRLAGQIGGAVAGYAPIIAVLGALAAGITVWKAWHEEAGKAKEEQEKLTDALEKWYDKQKEGPGGALPAQIDAMVAKIKGLREVLAALSTEDAARMTGFFGKLAQGFADVTTGWGKVTAAIGAIGQGGSRVMAWTRILTAGDLTAVATQFGAEAAKATAKVVEEIKQDGDAVIAARKEVSKKLEAAAVEARAKALTQETDMLGVGLAGPGAIQRMQAQSEAYTRMAQSFAASGDIAHALEYAHAAEQLTSAIDKESAAERARADALLKSIAATNERIAKLTIEIDADTRMARAKFQGQAAVDALTVSLAGEAAARELVGKAMPRQIEKVVELTRAHAEATIAARKQGEAERQLADDIQQAAKDVTDRITEMDKERERAAKAEEKYANDMQKEWLHWIEHVTTSGLQSFTKFFDSIYQLFTHMLERMTAAGKGDTIGAQLLGLGTTALGAGIAGYSVGASTQGNRGSAGLFGALGGASSGAALGSAVPGFGTAIGAAVGALAGLVGGILGAGHAADLSAHEMEKLQASLVTSMASAKAQIAGDALGAALLALHAQFDALRKAAEDAFATGKNEGERNKALAEINALEAARAKQLQDEAAVLRTLALSDLNVRTLAAQGKKAEADALAFALAQQREMIAAQKDTTAAGVAYAQALGLVQAAEAGARDAALKQAAADKLAAEARGLANIGLRIMTATNDPGLRAEQERLEIEALVASGASAATIALTKLAQAAEDTATAAQKAATAQQAMTDLTIRDLVATGKQAAADDLAFKNKQALETQAAIDAKASRAYMDLLAKTQKDEAAKRAADLLAAAQPSSGSLAAATAGATSAYAAVTSTVTQQSSLQLIDLTRAQVSTLNKIELNTRSSGSGGGNSGTSGIEVRQTNNFYRQVTEEDFVQIKERLTHDLDEALGSRQLTATLRTGSVNR